MKQPLDMIAVGERDGAAPIASHITRAWHGATRSLTPFRHWTFAQVLPTAVARRIVDLPLSPTRIDDTLGRRETHNSSRTFFSADNRAQYQVCDDVAAAFQSRAVVARIEEFIGIELRGSFVRIEYCQDLDGFWLEPHTDVSAKLLTLTTYLSDAIGSQDWGTDLYDGARERRGRVPAGFGEGFAFVPAADTLHGFEKRPLSGVRRSLIVNYVKPEWRARQELSFSDQPVI